jgi:polyisoprenoid-binding protein YceI
LTPAAPPLLRLLGLAWLCAAGMGVAHAAQQETLPPSETLALDTARSRAEFEVHVMWLFGIHGRFGTLHGTIMLDRFHGTASVDARIDVDDVTMRNHEYEAWVKSGEFFDAEHFPQIQFVSDAFAFARLDKGGDIEGVLTIRGVSKRESFRVEPTICAADAIARACPVTAEGTIHRSDFGMRSRRGALSDKVQMELSIFVVPAPEAAR